MKTTRRRHAAVGGSLTIDTSLEITEMDARLPPLRRKGYAPLATLCVAMLALLCSLYLAFDGQVAFVWAGLDAVYASQAASCAGGGNPTDRCGEEVAARHVDMQAG